ncbi:MAG: ABC transporter substrate-binding protein [Pseudomonadota bacterium]
MRLKLLLLLAVIIAAPASRAEPVPQRIVSMNLCTDQLLMDLVDPERIVAVSFLAADPISSNMPDLARTIGTHRGTAEEVLSLNPDLVVAGTFSTRHAVGILRALDYRVEQFTPAQSIEGVIENIERMGDLVGANARADQLVSQIRQARQAATHAVRPADPPLIYANYAVNGYTAGPGSLLADLVQTAGFTTLAETLERPGTRPVSLEQLIVSDPDVIDLGDDYGDPPSRGTQALKHPALKYLIDRSDVINVPARQTLCGTSRIATTLDTLRQKRREMLAP